MVSETNRYNNVHNNSLPSEVQNDQKNPPKLLKFFLAATGIFFLATPVIRSFVAWKRLPIYSMGSYGCALTASLIWSKRHPFHKVGCNASMVTKKN